MLVMNYKRFMSSCHDQWAFSEVPKALQNMGIMENISLRQYPGIGCNLILQRPRRDGENTAACISINNVAVQE